MSFLLKEINMTVKLNNIMLMVPMGLFGCTNLLNESSVNQISRSSSIFNRGEASRFVTLKNKDKYSIEPVLDRRTGLFWQKKAPLKVYNWDNNVISNEPLNRLVNVKDYCNALNELDGEDGWRTPKIDELKGLVQDPGSKDNKRTCTYLNSEFSPLEGFGDCFYWASETYGTFRYVLDFNTGEELKIQQYIPDRKGEKYKQENNIWSTIGIRCVRDFNESIDTKWSRFVTLTPKDNHKYSIEPVLDRKTNLVWQKKAPYHVYDWDNNVLTYEPLDGFVNVKDYCNALNKLDGEDGWRTPTNVELKGIVQFPGSIDDKRTCTYLNSAFEGFGYCFYWTSKTWGSHRHVVDFDNAEEIKVQEKKVDRKTEKYVSGYYSTIGIRCVRDFNKSIDPEDLERN